MISEKKYEFCSPNDVVNASQSTNDAYPCAIHMAMFLEHEEFLPHLTQMIDALEKKAKVPLHAAPFFVFEDSFHVREKLELG